MSSKVYVMPLKTMSCVIKDTCNVIKGTCNAIKDTRDVTKINVMCDQRYMVYERLM